MVMCSQEGSRMPLRGSESHSKGRFYIFRSKQSCLNIAALRKALRVLRILG